MVKASLAAIVFWIVFIAVCILIITSRSVLEIAIVIVIGIVVVLLNTATGERYHQR